MDDDPLQHYRDSLKHIVRPEKPSERLDQPHIELADFEAVYFVRHLYEYAAYEAETQMASTVARGYAEYIRMVVRDEGKKNVRLYAHTGLAWTVLLSAAEMGIEQEDEYVAVAASICDAVHDL